MQRQQGFTMVELMVTLTLLAFVIGLSTSVINFKDRRAKDNSTNLLSSLAAVETAFNNYFFDKSAYPTGMTDATFVPSYLFTPKPTDGYGDYSLANTSGNYYICVGTSSGVTSTDAGYLALTYVRDKVSADKFFINTSCGQTTNMAAPATSTTVYGTYWMMR